MEIAGFTSGLQKVAEQDPPRFRAIPQAPLCGAFFYTVHMANSSALPANAQNQYEITARDLPLSCPMPAMSLWNSHPRVYLPIEKTGWAKCPYCGTEYTLKKG